MEKKDNQNIVVEDILNNLDINSIFEIVKNREAHQKVLHRPFSGDPSDWMKFRNAFHAEVHKNSYFTNREKFDKLKRLLTVKDYELIQNLYSSKQENCYEEAWQVLQMHFNKRAGKEIIKNFVQLESDFSLNEFIKRILYTRSINDDNSWDSVLHHFIHLSSDVKMFKEFLVLLETHNKTTSSSDDKQMHVQEFSGKLLDWVEFRNSFNAKIHTNTELTDEYKFEELSLLLSSKDFKIIERLFHSDQEKNYEKAWKKLQMHFDGEAYHAMSEKMAELDCGQVLNEFAICLRELRELYDDKGIWDTLVIQSWSLLKAKIQMPRTYWEYYSNILDDFVNQLESWTPGCDFSEAIEKLKRDISEQPSEIDSDSKEKNTNKL